MNAYNNYLNYIEPPAPKNAFLYKKTPTKMSKNQNQAKKYLNDSAINLNKIKARATKYISDQRYRGELDTSSPGNKNILIDSDSEMTTNSKNANANYGCTKLVIEKIESQVPQINKEYYKFTNQIRNTNNDLNNQGIYFTKKNYISRKGARCDSNIRNNNRIIDRNYLNAKYNNKYNVQQEREFDNYNLIKNNNDYNSPTKKQYRRSTNNIFNSNYKYRQDLSNKKQINDNKNNSVIIRERNTSINYNNNYNNYLYNNDNQNDNEIENEEKIYNNKSYIPEKPNNMKYYKIIKNNKNNNYQRANKDISLNPERNSLYENYQDLKKLNTFNRITQYNNIHKNYNNTSMKYSKLNIYPSYNKKVVKIQSAWRGTYVRILMGFYWNLAGFKNILENIFRNHKYNYFFDLIKNLSHYPNENKENNFDYVDIDNINIDEKTLEEYKISLKQKEEDYDNLLRNYNSLVERCTELQDLLYKNKSEEKKGWSSSNKKKENDENINMKLKDIKQKKINFDINTNKDEKLNWKQLQIENNNVNIGIIADKKITDTDKVKEQENEINKLTDVKKFDIIEIEPIDKFDIIKPKKIKEEIEIKQEPEQENIDNGNNMNLRAKYKRKKKDTYQNYVDNFITNLSKINVEQLKIEEIPKKKEILPLEVSKLEISLLNENNIKEIEQIKNPKVFENEYIDKVNDNELSILGIKKIPSEKEIIPLEMSKIEISLLNDNNIKDLEQVIKPKIFDNEILDKANTNELSILGIKKISNNKNSIPLEISQLEISLLNEKNIKEIEQIIKPKIFENESIDKVNDNELSIIGIKKIVKKKDIIPLEISKLEISLINNNDIKETEIRGVVKPKIFDNEFIEKINDNELYILGIKKEIEKIKEKEEKKEFNLKEENQKHLNIEIQGKELNTLDKEFDNNKEKTDIISKDIINKKESINEIIKGDNFELIKNKKDLISKSFENNLIEKINDNELTIKGKKKVKKTKKSKKKKEKKDIQEVEETKENEETKEIEETKENVENENNKEIQETEESNKKEYILLPENQKNLSIELIGENPQISKTFTDFNYIDNNNSLSILKKPNKKKEEIITKTEQKEKPENIYSNVEQIFLEGRYKLNNDKNTNNDLIIEKVNNIIRLNENNIKNVTTKIELIPTINYNLFIKPKKKKRCEKTTEITDELNNILPCNNYELYIERILKKIIYINNKEQELQIINGLDGDKSKYIYNSINLEINKENALEINPILIKNSEITKENDIEIPYNKYSFFTEKAKDNMMKMILPVKLKVTLREFVQRNTFPLLIKYLKEIAEYNKK